MEAIKKIVYKLMVCALLSIAIPSGFFGKTSDMMQVQASEVIPETTIHYEFNNGTLQIYSTNDAAMPDYNYLEAAPWSSYKNGITKVVIKSSITHIGEWAFAECVNLKEVEIDNPSLTSIGANAFYKCERLEKISMPDSVSEIGAYAFGQCKNLNNCNIPQSLTVLDDFVFYQCEKLDNVKLPAQLKQICDGAFAYCGSLKTINLQDTNVERIGEAAFLQTSVAEIVMPETLHTLGAKAFENCSQLVYVSLPKDLNEIEKDAFLNCAVLKELQCSSMAGSKEQLNWSSTAFRGCDIKQIYLFKNTGVYNWFSEQGYSDIAIKELHIMSGDSTNYSVQLNESYTYTGAEICPEIRITYVVTGQTLVNTQDYILQYSNNINVGTASVKIIGRGAFSGSIVRNYTINQGNLGENGQNGATQNNAGTKDNFVDNATGTGQNGTTQNNAETKYSSVENATSIKKCKVKVSSQTYTGKEIVPKITVKLGKKTLQKDIDYIIFSCENNKKVGNKATITIKGINQYKDQKTVKFKITPPRAVLKQKGNKVVVKNYYSGANLIMEIKHNGKKVDGTVTATKYRTEGGYPLYRAKQLYKGQKIKIRAKLSSGKNLQGKWSKWIRIK